MYYQNKGIVVQSSHIYEMPHEVNRELGNDTLRIMSFNCSYKARASEFCKHVIAVLLLFNR